MAARQGADIPRDGAPSISEGTQAGQLEAPQVRAMFDRIAGIYDLLNTAMSAGLHHRWRARAVDEAHVGAGSRVLDVATGTGDLAFELAARVAPGGEVIGSDFSERMLDRARAKSAGRSDLTVSPRFESGDATALPYEDDSFDAATVGFAARNFDQLDLGLREMVRVVRPGGRVVVLEFTTPTRAPLSWFYRLWFDRIVPTLGAATGALSSLRSRAGSSDGAPTISEAYTYLPNSVKRFPGPEQLARELELAGLREISWLITAGGIVVIHAGTVPDQRP